MVKATYEYTGSLDTILRLIVDSSRPAAIFCATDNLSMEDMDIARFEFSLRIPDDIQVISFDNIPQTEWLSYQLTTFALDFKLLARESVKIIVDQITTRNQSMVKLMVPTKLIQRKSTLKY